MRRPAKFLALGTVGALIAVVVVHEVFPRRSDSLQEWLAVISRTRAGEVLASSVTNGHYVAIQQSADGCAILWVRHPDERCVMRTMLSSMESPLGSLHDESRPEANEQIRLDESWISGDGRDGEGSATPIRDAISGAIEFELTERIGCANPLAYRTTVAWR